MPEGLDLDARIHPEEEEEEEEEPDLSSAGEDEEREQVLLYPSKASTFVPVKQVLLY